MPEFFIARMPKNQNKKTPREDDEGGLKKRSAPTVHSLHGASRQKGGSIQRGGRMDVAFPQSFGRLTHLWEKRKTKAGGSGIVKGSAKTTCLITTSDNRTHENGW